MKSWFERHLNWAIPVIIAGTMGVFTLQLFVSSGWTFSNLYISDEYKLISYNYVVCWIASSFFNIAGFGWVLKHKNRSAWFLLFAIIVALGMPLAVEIYMFPNPHWYSRFDCLRGSTILSFPFYIIGWIVMACLRNRSGQNGTAGNRRSLKVLKAITSRRLFITISVIVIIYNAVSCIWWRSGSRTINDEYEEAGIHVSYLRPVRYHGFYFTGAGSSNFYTTMDTDETKKQMNMFFDHYFDILSENILVSGLWIKDGIRSSSEMALSDIIRGLFTEADSYYYIADSRGRIDDFSATRITAGGLPGYTGNISIKGTYIEYTNIRYLYVDEGENVLFFYVYDFRDDSPVPDGFFNRIIESFKVEYAEPVALN